MRRHPSLDQYLPLSVHEAARVEGGGLGVGTLTTQAVPGLEIRVRTDLEAMVLHLNAGAGWTAYPLRPGNLGHLRARCTCLAWTDQLLLDGQTGLIRCRACLPGWYASSLVSWRIRSGGMARSWADGDEDRVIEAAFAGDRRARAVLEREGLLERRLTPRPKLERNRQMAPKVAEMQVGTRVVAAVPDEAWETPQVAPEHNRIPARRRRAPGKTRRGRRNDGIVRR